MCFLSAGHETILKRLAFIGGVRHALGDEALRSWTRTDGFGRTTESWIRDPQGDVKVVTIYDALSRVSKVSNPHRPSLGESAAHTTTIYDLAGRVTS